MMPLIRVIDVETSGLDPAVHRVCEIACVDVIVGETQELVEAKTVDGQSVTGRKVTTVERGEMWSSLVNHGIAIPPEASAIHDITDEMVKDAPMMPDLYPRIKAGPPDYFCAHHNRFDEKFVKVGPWLDTYRIALWLWPDAPEHKLTTLRYWLKIKLDEHIVGTFRKASHCALFDAYVCAAVLRRAFMSGATIEQMVEVSSQPALLSKFHFGQHQGVPIEKVPSSYLDWVLKNFEREKEDERHTAFAELQRRRNLERISQ